jgi:hypothetical protein
MTMVFAVNNKGGKTTLLKIYNVIGSVKHQQQI